MAISYRSPDENALFSQHGRFHFNIESVYCDWWVLCSKRLRINEAAIFVQSEWKIRAIAGFIRLEDRWIVWRALVFQVPFKWAISDHSIPKPCPSNFVSPLTGNLGFLYWNTMIDWLGAFLVLLPRLLSIKQFTLQGEIFSRQSRRRIFLLRKYLLCIMDAHPLDGHCSCNSDIQYSGC